MPKIKKWITKRLLEETDYEIIDFLRAINKIRKITLQKGELRK